MKVGERIAIIGSGAVGLYYGTRLALAGFSVSFQVRSNADLIRKEGIFVETEKRRGSWHWQRPAVFQFGDLLAPFDWILVALKTTANSELASLVSPYLKGNTHILTLQNGLGNIEKLADIHPSEFVFAGLCFICLNRIEPNRVKRLIPGSLTIGAMDFSKHSVLFSLQEAFTKSGINCKTTSNLKAMLWKKLCWNIPFNGLSIASGGKDTAAILGSASLKAKLWGLLLEVQKAAVAMGITIEEKFLEKQITLTESMGAYQPSSLIDFLNGDPVEVESIWGEPLRLAQAKGAELPLLQELYHQIQHRCLTRK